MASHDGARRPRVCQNRSDWTMLKVETTRRCNSADKTQLARLTQLVTFRAMIGRAIRSVGKGTDKSVAALVAAGLAGHVFRLGGREGIDT